MSCIFQECFVVFLIFSRRSRYLRLIFSASFIHLFIPDISIAPLQVHYYSEALPTQHGYCVGVSRRKRHRQLRMKDVCKDVAARAGFEPTTLRSTGIDSNNEPPRPNMVVTPSLSLFVQTINYINELHLS